MQIPRYTRGIIRERQTPTQLEVKSNVFNEIAQVSGTVVDVAEQFKLANDTTAVNEAVISAQKQKIELSEAARKERQDNPFGFAKEFEPKLKKLDDEIAKSLPSAAARKAYQETAARSNLQLFEQNFRWQNEREANIYASRIEKSLEDNATLAYRAGQEGQSLDEYLKNVDASTIAAGSVFSRNKLEKLNGAGREKAAMAWLSGMMQSNLPMAKQKLDSGEIDFIGAKNIGHMERQIKLYEEAEEKALIEAQQLPIKDQIKNQAQVMKSLEDPNISAKEKLAMISEMDFKGIISDKFASEAISYINKTKDTTAIPDTERFKAFSGLTDKLSELRVKFGGDLDKVGDITLTQERLDAFRAYQSDVMTELAAGKITIGESKSLLNGVTSAVNFAIEGKRFDEAGLELFTPGITEVSTKGLEKINSYLQKNNRENDFKVKKDLFMAFNDNLGKFDKNGNYQVTGRYESTGVKAMDEKIINTALKRAIQQVNVNNYSGIINPENPPNAMVIPTFNTVEDMEAANLPDGTPVIVGGVRGIARSQ